MFFCSVLSSRCAQYKPFLYVLHFDNCVTACQLSIAWIFHSVGAWKLGILCSVFCSCTFLFGVLTSVHSLFVFAVTLVFLLRQNTSCAVFVCDTSVSVNSPDDCYIREAKCGCFLPYWNLVCSTALPLLFVLEVEVYMILCSYGIVGVAFVHSLCFFVLIRCQRATNTDCLRHLLVAKAFRNIRSLPLCLFFRFT